MNNKEIHGFLYKNSKHIDDQVDILTSIKVADFITDEIWEFFFDIQLDGFLKNEFEKLNNA